MPAIAKKNNTLIYKGSNNFRQRLVLSILSGKPVRIIEIRSQADDPGISDYEVSLIRLIDKITNGTHIELNETGTTLYFQPGLLHGGKVEHECNPQRSLGYYLEVLLMLGLFCKVPFHATLQGVTANNIDPSVDHIKTSMISTLKKFILEDEDLVLKITKRGMPPLGGGEVVLKCPVRRQLRPIQLLESGMVKSVRGTAYALRMSPVIANRMVDTAKGVLLKFIPDVYINTDQCKGKASGKSPGFGIHLYVETTKGIFYSAEQVCKINIQNDEDPSIPEDIGTAVAHRLLQEIYLGGCTDSCSQAIALLSMALGQKDVSRIILGPLTEYTINFLQHLHEFFGITFKIENYEPGEDEPTAGSNKVSLTCIGIGFTNLSKKTI